MDELAALIIEKLREDDGPRRGMVALASWWYSDERLNLMVQPVVKNGRLSYNILKSKWQSIEVGNAPFTRGESGWLNVSDDVIKTFPPTVPVCNFLTLEQAANFLLAMGKSGECPIRCSHVISLVVGKDSYDLFRVKGAKCDTKEDVLTWLRLMDEMRPPIV